MPAAPSARLVPTTIAAIAAGVAAFAQLYGLQAQLPALSRDLGIDAGFASVIQSAAAVGIAAAVLPWSLLAARAGRSRTLRVAVVAIAVVGILVPLLPDATSLLIGRFFSGVATAAIPTLALATLKEAVDRETGMRIAGWYIAGTSIGGLLGRIVAGSVGDLLGWRLGAVAVAVLSAVAALLVALLMPPPRPGLPAPPRLGRALRNRRVLAAAGLALLLMGAFSATWNLLSFHLTGDFGVPDALIGVVFVLYLLGTASSALIVHATRRFGARPVVVVLVLLLAGGLLLTLVPALPVVLAGMGLATAAFFAVHAIAAGAAADGGGAAGSAVYTLAFYIGGGLVGAVGGVLYVALGWTGFAVVMGVIAAAALLPVLLIRPSLPADTRPAAAVGAAP